MPASRSDYVLLAVISLILVGALALLSSMGWLSEQPEDAPPVRTTNSAGPQGAMAFSMLMEDLGTPLEKMRYPLSMKSLQSIDVLIMIDPLLALKTQEIDELKKWIFSGGVVIATEDVELDDLVAEDVRNTPRMHGGSVSRPQKEGRSTHVLPSFAGLPLARDVSSVWFASGKILESSGSADGPVEELFRDERGLRIAMWPSGRGWVMRLSDSSFLSNEYLKDLDNSVLAANLLAFALTRGRGHRAAYDEYHLGFGVEQSSWSTLWGVMAGSSAGWAVLTAGLAGAFFLVLKGRRFGTRRDGPRSRRRSKLEYVISVGATYRARGAHRLALRLIYTHVKLRCAAVAGLPANASAKAVAAQLARRTGRPAEHYEAILQACDLDLKAPRLSSRLLARRLKVLGELEAEISNESRTGK